MLKSLVDFYELKYHKDYILEKDEDSDDSLSGEVLIAKPGYSPCDVSYAIKLNKNGQILQLEDLRISRNENEAPTLSVPMIVPFQEVRSSGYRPYFLCENYKNMFATSGVNKAKKDELYALHKNVLQSTNSEFAKAILLFFENIEDNIAEFCKDKNNASLFIKLSKPTEAVNLVFVNEDDEYAHHNIEILKAWENYYFKSKTSKQEDLTICALSEKEDVLCDVHQKIKHIKGANPAGGSLVSYNQEANLSYGADKNNRLKSHIGEYGAFAYATALNYLLKNKNYNYSLDNTRLVFFAHTASNKENELFSACLSGTLRNDLSDEIYTLFEKIRSGESSADFTQNEKYSHCKYTILGLAPNIGRISVKLFIEDDFSKILSNQLQHQKDMEVISPYGGPYKFIYISNLIKQTVREAIDNPNTARIDSGVVRSILTGQAYPHALYIGVLSRVRVEKEVSREKAAIIKGYLTRKYKNDPNKEEITVSLNKDSTSRAYNLGRLFSVIEKMELISRGAGNSFVSEAPTEDVIEENDSVISTATTTKGKKFKTDKQEPKEEIMSNVKARYFTSACSTPRTIFPVILKLNNHHVRSAKNNSAPYIIKYQKILDEVMGKIQNDGSEFPSRLSLEEQGLFILGYYHQNADYYKSKQ